MGFSPMQVGMRFHGVSEDPAVGMMQVITL
jgi:hypothetical protein